MTLYLSNRLNFLRLTTKIATRWCSTSFVDVKLENNGIGVVAMKKPPVNSLSLEMIQSLSKALTDLENQKCKAFILTSMLPTIFSAGLDIREMYQPKEDRLRSFWSALQNLWIQLYSSKMATVAVINGHSPAGGCLISMCCDYRIMVDGKFKIGLNETQLGIVAPFWFKDTMANIIGFRQTELALQLGTLFSPQEALDIGLIDKIAPDANSALQLAQSKLQEFCQIPSHARYASKMVMRQETVSKLADNLESDINRFVNFAAAQHIQKGLGLYLEKLSKKG